MSNSWEKSKRSQLAVCVLCFKVVPYWPQPFILATGETSRSDDAQWCYPAPFFISRILNTQTNAKILSKHEGEALGVNMAEHNDDRASQSLIKGKSPGEIEMWSVNKHGYRCITDVVMLIFVLHFLHVPFFYLWNIISDVWCRHSVISL